MHFPVSPAADRRDLTPLAPWKIALCWLGTLAGTAVVAHVGPLTGSRIATEALGLIPAVFMLLLPYELSARVGDDAARLGFTRTGLVRSLAAGLLTAAVVLPLFGLCVGPALRSGGAAVGWLVVPQAPPEGLLRLLGEHVFVVGLTEEMFYRGWLQAQLFAHMPRAWFVWGGGRVGPATVLASALFALGHLPQTPHPARLAVFFPSLLFGWLYDRDRNVAGAALLHGLSNVWLFSLLTGAGL